MTENILCVGEALLRLSAPTGVHLYDTNSLTMHYGGAEANVAVNLSRLDHKTTMFTKVPNHQLGHAAITHLRKHGVDTTPILCGGDRLGTYYVNNGVAERPSTVIYDRAYSSLAQIDPEEVDVEALLEGKTLLHITGITAALSPAWRPLAKKLIVTAKELGVKVNFDMNYRSKLWSVEEAGAFLRDVLPYVDYLSAGKLDAINFLHIEEPAEEVNDKLDYYYDKMHELYPNLEIIYATLRNVLSANHNTLQGALWQDGQTYYSKVHDIDHIVDRIGGGDAFAAGVLHGILIGKSADYCISFATAFSSLKHTVVGDVCPFSIEETERTMSHDAAVDR